MNEIVDAVAGLSPERLQRLADDLMSDRRKATANGSLDRPILVPLSYSQEGLWAIERLGLADTTYNLHLEIRLSGELNVAALERALTSIVARHEALRTRISTTNEESYQEVDPAPQISLELLDLSLLSSAARTNKLADRLQTESVHKFDLSTGPLFRATLYRLSEQEHVLSWVVHHIVWDAWSIGIFLTELTAFYSGEVRGKPLALPPVAMQYADFAVWQRRRLTDEVIADQVAFWRGRLGDAPATYELPIDHPRPVTESARGARVDLAFDEDITRQLNELAGSERTTLYTVLLTACQLWLSRWTGRHDAIVGSPIAGRQLRQINGTIGYFSNSLAMRLEVDGESTFRELLRSSRDNVLDAFAHGDLPFNRLVGELKPNRDRSRHPIYQVELALHKFPSLDLKAPGLTLNVVQRYVGTAKFDLALEFVEARNRLSGFLEYRTELFDATTIRRAAGSVETLLRAIVRNPDEKVIALPLITAEERERVVREFNNTRVLRRELSLAAMFDEQVARTPDAVALICDGQKMTYEELSRKANQLAHRLRSLGVVRNGRVGICLGRGAWMIVSILAVLKAGAGYVPLDPKYPSERLTYLLDDAAPDIIITEGSFNESVPNAIHKVPVVDLTKSDLDGCPNYNPPECDSADDQLAYILYTSGSTGRPKGVEMGQRALANLIEWERNCFNSRASQRTLLFTPLSFDVSFCEIFMTLTTGGALVVADESARTDPATLCSLIREQQVARVFLPFIALQHLAEHATRSGDYPLCLEDVVSTAEPLRIGPALREFFRHLPACRLHNQYGPTETHVVGAYTLGEDPSGWEALPPIGRPIDNSQLYVLDSARHPVSVGTTGEIWIGGAALARGYWGQPELTAERFVADPFSVDPGARLYKTGDQGRWRADGNLEMLGRNDHQVKIRGARVEPREIETYLTDHPKVKEAVAIAHEVTADDRRLVAYVVGVDGAPPSVQELRDHVDNRLPDFLRPSAYIILDELPLNSNDKVDRSRLPAPEWGSDRTAEFEAPIGPIETALAEIWMNVLKCQHVGRTDSFFDLGGDSVLAIQIAGRASHLGMRTTGRDVFEQETIANLAAIVKASAPVSDPEIPATAVHGDVPLSPAQRYMIRTTSAEYFRSHLMVLFIESIHPLPGEQLRSAVRALMAHHDALRCRLLPGSDVRMHNMAIEEVADQDVFEEVDLSKLDPPAQASALSDLSERLRRTNIDESVWVFRVVQINLGAGRSQMAVAVHHAIWDMVSSSIFLEDFTSACDQVRSARAVRLPPRTTSFLEWSRLIANRADAPLVAELALWRDRLAPERVNLPVERVEDSAEVIAFATKITGADAIAFRALIQEEGLTAEDLLLASIARGLRLWTGRNEHAVGVMSHGRDVFFDGVDVSRTIGWFSTQWPVILKADERTSSRELLENVRQESRRAALEGPTYWLLRHGGPEDRLAGCPQPCVSVNHFGNFQSDEDDGSLRMLRRAVRRWRKSDGGRDVQIQISSGFKGDLLELVWTCDERMMQESTARKLAADVMEALRNILTDMKS
jgi:amino acid adenylation domain-containing protein